MNQRFFKPFVGAHFEEGIQGKKVLVVGASFYCPRTDCRFYRGCTDRQTKDSSAFNAICPPYAEQSMQLCDEPSYNIECQPQAYRTFAKAMSRYTGTADYKDTWNRMAFTNYVQFFLPSDGEGYGETLQSDLSERDYAAFNETLQEMQPDVVIVWGCAFNYRVKEQNEYLEDRTELDKTEGYVCHLRVPGVDHPIALVNSYHPSSGAAWHNGLDAFYRYMDQVLSEELDEK